MAGAGGSTAWGGGITAESVASPSPNQGCGDANSVRSFLAPAVRRACPLALGHFGRAKDG